MLNHQIEFSKACADIYKPISGRMSDPDSFVDDVGNPEGIRACEEYETIVHDLQSTLQPELELIETRIIRPADELLEVIKAVRKLCAKRDHKQLDYDRHRSTLKKLEDKKDKTLKDEKALYKAENDVELATQDYNHFNEMLKDELPQLFKLEREFIKPLFQSFYYMQLNIFYTLHERMQHLDIGYFDMSTDVEEGYEAKRGDIQEETEKLSIVKFKTTGGNKRLSKYTTKKQEEAKANAAGGSRRDEEAGIDNPPPAYSAEPAIGSTSLAGASGIGRSNSVNLAAAAKAKGAAPPPPKPKPKALAGHALTETATALYDFEAQANGDLSFTTGDTIEIVTRTQNENEWWTGKLNGRQGQFPGMSYLFGHVKSDMQIVLTMLQETM